MLSFHDETSAVSPRSERMEQRTTVEAKLLIERAARSLGITASEFVTATATQAARETIRRYESTVLDPQGAKAFMDAFEATEPTPALRDLMRLHGEITNP